MNSLAIVILPPPGAFFVDPPIDRRNVHAKRDAATAISYECRTARKPIRPGGRPISDAAHPRRSGRPVSDDRAVARLLRFRPRGQM